MPKPTTSPLTIKDHRFEPAELEVPAGKATDRSTSPIRTRQPEEFESDDFDAEKVIRRRTERRDPRRSARPGPL